MVIAGKPTTHGKADEPLAGDIVAREVAMILWFVGLINTFCTHSIPTVAAVSVPTLRNLRRIPFSNRSVLTLTFA